MPENSIIEKNTNIIAKIIQSKIKLGKKNLSRFI